MARKATTTTQETKKTKQPDKKAVAAASVKSPIKTTAKTPKKTAPSTSKDTNWKSARSSNGSNSFFSAVKKSPIGNVLSKRYLYLGALLLLVLGAIWLASRFLVVAWVDKQPVTRIEFYKALEQKYGKDVREQLIVEKLVASEAKRRNVSVSEQEISDEVKKIETEQGGKEQLDQILQIQGIAESEFRNLVRLQLLKQRMFGEDIAVSDQEVTQYLTENSQSLPAATDSASQALQKEQVSEQLKQQKINTNFNNWLRDALGGSRVVRS
jgi:hypothetical protein